MNYKAVIRLFYKEVLDRRAVPISINPSIKEWLINKIQLLCERRCTAKQLIQDGCRFYLFASPKLNHPQAKY